MARRKCIFENHSKKLIKLLTGFEEYEENFGICLQFTLSNFKFHRFLAVDRHKVSQKIEGIHSKFIVHSELKKAEVLKQLTEKFLSIPAFEGKNFGETDTHYALLLLLLNVSDSPTQHAYREPCQTLFNEAKDNFDWAAYLKEGETVDMRPFPESPDLSEEEEVETGDITESSSINLPLAHDREVHIAHQLPMGLENDWLQQNVVNPYWESVQAVVSESDSYYNVVKDWECYELKINPLYTNYNKITLTEVRIIREILWMLQGIPHLFVFEFDGQDFTLRKNLRVSHLTMDSLKNSMKMFTISGSQIHELESFIAQVVSCSSQVGTNSTHTPLTYYAFVDSLSTFLADYKVSIISVEKRILQQEETMTILLLRSLLKPMLNKLSLVHSIYTKGVKKCDATATNRKKASKLLSCLFRKVMHYSCLGEEEMLSVVIPLWVETSKPYITITDSWITEGKFADVADEFIIRKDEAAKSHDEMFWEKSFVLNCQNKIKWRGMSSARNSVETSESALEIPAYSALSGSPKFLRPILASVIQAGKSMEVFQSVGKLSEVVDYSANKYTKPLYDMFVESLYEAAKRTNVACAELTSEQSNDTCPVENLFVAESFPAEDCSTSLPVVRNQAESQNIQIALITPGNQQVLLRDDYDHLLHVNMENLLAVNHCHSEGKTPVRNSLLHHIRLTSLHPIDQYLEHCLYAHVRKKRDSVCKRLVEVLKTDYHLMNYLAAMQWLRSDYLTKTKTVQHADSLHWQIKLLPVHILWREHFFLMEAGDTLYNFYSEIFNKICTHDNSWKNVITLNIALKQALQEHFSEDVERLTVVLDPEVPKTVHTLLNETDCIRLKYKVPWPVDIVINSHSQRVYNKIFRFLLQIKHAKYALDELRFSDLEKDPVLKTSYLQKMQVADDSLSRKQKIHCVQIFRKRLIFLVNGLHMFVMTRILHSTGLEFMQELEQAADLDSILTIHSQYVKNIYHRCFFHPRIKSFMWANVQLLNLALKLRDMWTQGIDQIRMSTVLELERDCFEWIKFLSDFLSSSNDMCNFLPYPDYLASCSMPSISQINLR